MIITTTSKQAINVTKRDLRAFEQALIDAARRNDEREVTIRNTQRGYILFGLWHPEFLDTTPEAFASAEVSLLLDGVAGIAAL